MVELTLISANHTAAIVRSHSIDNGTPSGVYPLRGGVLLSAEFNPLRANGAQWKRRI